MEDDALILEPAQLAALTRCLQHGLGSATTSLGIDTVSSQAAVCGLAEFPEHAVFDGSEMLACVRLPLRGALEGVGILALDPHGVMHLVGRRQEEPDPGLIPRYLTLAGEMLGGLAGSLGSVLGGAAGLGAPELVEGPLVPCVLGTHAPPDTVVVSCRLGLAHRSTSVAALVYLLVGAKPTGRLVEALSR